MKKSNLIQLLPIFFLLIAHPFLFQSDKLSVVSLILALCYMFFYIIFSEKGNLKIIIGTLIFMPFFLIHFFISFSYQAAFEDGIRYLLPIIILLYSYSIRFAFKRMFNFLIFYMLASFFYQIIIYYYYLNGVTQQWFYNEVAAGIFSTNTQFGLIRATGLLGFFDVYGFLNFIMFFLIHYFYDGRYKYSLQIIAVVSLMLTFSFKLILTFFMICLFIRKFRLKTILFLGSLSLIFGIFFSNFSKDVQTLLTKKIAFYVTQGNSARSESYRVMIDELKSFNIIGKGVGSFGGPASTKYNSPVYKEVNFDWYETKQLTTTDSYFPHLIVELGIIASFLYLILLFLPFFRNRNRIKLTSLKMISIIYIGLFLDSVFSFALNDIIYLLFSLLLVYPIIEYKNYKVDLQYED